MPVEIKELVIRAVVDPRREQPATSAPEASTSAAAARGGEEQAALVAATVKEVLRILRASKER